MNENVFIVLEHWKHNDDCTVRGVFKSKESAEDFMTQAQEFDESFLYPQYRYELVESFVHE
jgi:hypothetical protein